jgi:hypothetical protein
MKSITGGKVDESSELKSPDFKCKHCGKAIQPIWAIRTGYCSGCSKIYYKRKIDLNKEENG